MGGLLGWLRQRICGGLRCRFCPRVPDSTGFYGIRHANRTSQRTPFSTEGNPGVRRANWLLKIPSGGAAVRDGSFLCQRNAQTIACTGNPDTIFDKISGSSYPLFQTTKFYPFEDDPALCHSQGSSYILRLLILSFV